MAVDMLSLLCILFSNSVALLARDDGDDRLYSCGAGMASRKTSWPGRRGWHGLAAGSWHHGWQVISSSASGSQLFCLTSPSILPPSIRLAAAAAAAGAALAARRRQAA